MACLEAAVEIEKWRISVNNTQDSTELKSSEVETLQTGSQNSKVVDFLDPAGLAYQFSGFWNVNTE